MAISEWAGLVEPVPDAAYTVPSAPSDINIVSPTKGLVCVTPDGVSLYRIFIDSDGAVASEYVAPFSGVIPSPLTLLPEPFPVFGLCSGDIMLLSAGKGLVVMRTPRAGSPRQFYRISVDNDGAVQSDPTALLSWWLVPEVNIPFFGVDTNNNWIFETDLAIIAPSQGIIMPCRGGTGTRRLRVDTDGAVLIE